MYKIEFSFDTRQLLRIALILWIAYVSTILAKLDLSDRTQAAVIAIKHGVS